MQLSIRETQLLSEGLIKKSTIQGINGVDTFLHQKAFILVLSWHSPACLIETRFFPITPKRQGYLSVPNISSDM